MKQAISLHRTEYLVASLIFVGAAIWQKDLVGWMFWLFLLAPDVFGLLPAGVWLYSVRAKPGAAGRPSATKWRWTTYNLWHTYTVPAVLWIGALLLFATNPWPLLGWLIHISLDRLLGFGLRGDDGGQALF